MADTRLWLRPLILAEHQRDSYLFMGFLVVGSILAKRAVWDKASKGTTEALSDEVSWSEPEARRSTSAIPIGG